MVGLLSFFVNQFEGTSKMEDFYMNILNRTDIIFDYLSSSSWKHLIFSCFWFAGLSESMMMTAITLWALMSLLKVLTTIGLGYLLRYVYTQNIEIDNFLM